MFPLFSSTRVLWYVVKTQFCVSSFIPITEGNIALLCSWYLCICVMAVCGYLQACYLGHSGGLSLTLDSGGPGLHKFWVPLMRAMNLADKARSRITGHILGLNILRYNPCITKWNTASSRFINVSYYTIGHTILHTARQWNFVRNLEKRHGRTVVSLLGVYFENNVHVNLINIRYCVNSRPSCVNLCFFDWILCPGFLSCHRGHAYVCRRFYIELNLVIPYDWVRVQLE